MTFAPSPLSLFERIVGGLDVSGDCWVWTRSLSGSGYGQIYVDGSPKEIHRLVYELAVGPIPAGLLVCHHCDNPPCARPSHLFAGTQSDNIRDMFAKGRSAKLTEAQVREIRAYRGPRREAAARYGVHKNTIQKVLSRETWGHVPEAGLS